MAQTIEAPIHIPQEGAAEAYQMVVQPYYADRFERLKDRRAGLRTPQPQFVGAAVVEDFWEFRGEENDHEVLKLAQDMTDAHNLIAGGDGVPIFSVNLACMDAGIASESSGLYVIGTDRGVNGGADLAVPVKTGIEYHLGHDGDIGARTSGPEIIENNAMKLLMPKVVLVTGSESAAREAVKGVGEPSSGVLAVGEKAVTEFLKAVADNEYGDPENRSHRRHETGISLLGIAALKRQGAELPLGSDDFIHEVGMDIVARLIVSGLDREMSGYYARSINCIAQKLQAFDFTAEDQPLIAERSLKLMEESEIYRALANLANLNGGSVEELVKDQVNSLLKNLLGVKPSV